MTEQELPHIPQEGEQSIEKIDVTSLTRIDMSLADYLDYIDADPDDLRVIDLIDRYGIKPGEFVIVSAKDPENPENDILRVVTTDSRDFFTTNRSMTDELEAHLSEDEGTANQVSTLEQEQIVSMDDVKELGDLALEATSVTFEAQAVKERGTEIKSGLTMGLVESLASRLVDNAQYSRERPGQYRGMDKAEEAYSLLEAFRKGAVSKEDMLVVSSTLLGASGDRSGIEAVFSIMRSSNILDTTEVSDLSTQLSSIAEVNSTTNPNSDQVKIGYINSLIDRAQGVIDANDHIPNQQYQALVGLVMGLSTQIANRSASHDFILGALSQLRKMEA